MKAILRSISFLFALITPLFLDATLYVGIGKTEITPPIGTPSAGYSDRKEGMKGVHDPLFAIALFMDNGDKKLVFCSVDHLGFTYKMTQEVTQQIQAQPGLEACEVYIGSSHTHSGGGAYLDIPVLGESLAGKYNSQIEAFYVKMTADAIIRAYQTRISAKMGIGNGNAENLSKYRGQWPTDILPLTDLTLIKITKLDDSPFAVLFNFPLHPTILRKQNLYFSADFIGYARQYIQHHLGDDIQPLYFNGAQGDIVPITENNDFETCRVVGSCLADAVQKIWDQTKTSTDIQIQTQKQPYSFKPQETPFGLLLPLNEYKSEMNVIIFNQTHAFLTIPGELSCLYDYQLKEFGKKIGYDQVSILGLVNDAHGYIILPEAWKNKTSESHLSFGGEFYGEQMKNRAISLLKIHAPQACSQ